MRPEERFEQHRELLEKHLDICLSGDELPQKRVFDAMNYSLLSGGKRIRPVILLEFCRISGGDVKKALPFAAAVEMVHTYSLVHDDLPCMDNDDMRRGKPANHKVFGEALAVLAGDGLLTAAFETMLSPKCVEAVGSGRAVRAAHTLAMAAGAFGMAGGQTLDIEAGDGADVSYEKVMEIYAKKTGALIEAAAVMGVIIGGGGGEAIDAAKRFAGALGLAFQIRDDLLDSEGDPGLLGRDKCISEIKRQTMLAKAETAFWKEGEMLLWLADTLAVRNN